MLLSWRKWSVRWSAVGRHVGAILFVVSVAVALCTGGMAEPAGAATVTVQPGQNLTAIAAELHTTVTALAAANGISDVNRVLAGQQLVIPGTESPGAGGAGLVIVVQRGQSLTAIAGRYGVSVAALAAANGISNPNRVLAGQQLVIPGTEAASGTMGVVVQPGQTLTAIASRYGVTVAALAAANGISDVNRVLAGQRLVIPSAVAGSGMALTAYSVPAPGNANLPAQLLAHPGRLSLEPDFTSAAATFAVPTALLEALCWWESGWQEDIVSVTGAVGVCQIEPATATFINRYLVRAPLSPQVASQNIALGAAFLSSLLRATGGNVGQALAGYYQGLTSVRQQGMLPSTATYVQGVEAYAAIFAAAG